MTRSTPTRPAWTPPVLERRDFPAVPDRAPSERPAGPMPSIAGVPVETLVDGFGSPLFVIDGGRLAATVDRWRDAMRSRFERHAVAYALQANPTAAVVAAVAARGAWMAAASPMELAIARDLGVPAERILFHGPGRRDEQLRAALADGVAVVLESEEEAELLIGAGAPADAAVFLRVHAARKIGGWSRFGLPIAGGRALEVGRRIVERGLRLRGLAINLGTDLHRPAQFEGAAAELGKLARDLDCGIDSFDLGGGFPSGLPRLQDGDAAPEKPAAPEDFLDAIEAGLAGWRRFAGPGARVIVEPGRALVAEAVGLVCTVVARKRSAGGKRIVIVDGGVNLVPSAYWYAHPIHPARRGPGAREDVFLAGPLCMQIDCLRKEISLPPLDRGDRIILTHAGAYGWSQSMQFIFPRGGIVFVEDGRVHPAREPEGPMDLRGLDRVPERLRGFELVAGAAS